MKIIALEEHASTRALQDALSKLPDAKNAPSIGSISHAEVEERLLDLGAGRLRAMDDMGVDVAVLSITAPGTQMLEAAQAIPLAREANDALAAATRAHPDRFAAFATLPTADPTAAARELERAVTELGCRGAMVHGRTGERPLDHPMFSSVLEAAARLNVPLYLHPQVSAKPVREAYYDGFEEALSSTFATSGWGWHMETGVYALRLILAGVFDRHPGLQVILGHWGEMIPLFLDRVDSMTAFAKHLERPIARYVRENFFIAPSGIWSRAMMRHALEVMSVERILYAVDYPYIRPEGGQARAFLADAPIASADKEKIGHLNAARLLRLPG